MIKVRNGVFETNSSSTHSITMCTKDQYEQWKNGELYWSRWGECFVRKSDVEAAMNEYRKSYFADDSESSEEDFLNDFLEDESYYSFDDFVNNIGYEEFYSEFTSPSGETIVAFGYYGYDS